MYDRIENWMRSYGDVTIYVLAVIPKPLVPILVAWQPER